MDPELWGELLPEAGGVAPAAGRLPPAAVSAFVLRLAACPAEAVEGRRQWGTLCAALLPGTYWSRKASSATDAPPGSEAKIREMTLRHARREALHHPGDAGLGCAPGETEDRVPREQDRVSPKRYRQGKEEWRKGRQRRAGG